MLVNKKTKFSTLQNGGSLGGKNDPTDVDNLTIEHNKALDNADQGSNFFGVSRNTPSGRTLGDLDVASAHAFRRANSYIDPVTRESLNFGDLQDRFLGDRPGLSKEFEGNAKLVDQFGDLDSYYRSIQKDTDSRIKRRSNATVEGGFSGLFTPEFIDQNSQASDEALGSTTEQFRARRNDPRTPIPQRREGGKLVIGSYKKGSGIDPANQF